ncbi:MAG: type II secretion system F family protein [Pseudomonadota bacterium]
MNFQFVIFGLVFLGILLIIQGVYLVMFGKSISGNSRINRRLALLEQTNDYEEVLLQLRKEREQHKASTGIPIYSILAHKAQQANIAFTPAQIIMVMCLVSVVATGALLTFTSSGLYTAVLVGLAMGFGGMYLWIVRKANARIALFEEQLPDALDLIVRSLRVGHPFANAINIVADEMADPIGSEFGLVADETTYGMELSAAVEQMANRIDVPDLKFLSVAVGIQARSGGNLVEILDGLSKVIRARFKLFRRVQAITAEAKWSGMFLSMFPFAALALINITRPGYYDEVRESALFVPAALGVVTMLVINIFVMRAMVNIKV